MFTVALESVDVPLFAGLRQPPCVRVDVPRYTPRTSGKPELSSSPPPQPYNTREHNNPTTAATNDTCARVIVVSFPLCVTRNSSIPLLPPSALHATTASKGHHTLKNFFATQWLGGMVLSICYNTTHLTIILTACMEGFRMPIPSPPPQEIT